MTSSTTVAVQGVGLTKVFGRPGEEQTQALRGVDVELRSGSITALMGPSGSGKSTLLYCLAGLDTPTTGHARLLEREVASLSRADLARFRRDHVGFIFQQYNLIPSLSVFDNVALPQRLAGTAVDASHIDSVLDSVGMLEKRNRLPAQLSGGQQQRVAIARVVATKPEIVFADEPTGALDTGTGAAVLDLLHHAAASQGQCVVMATHDPSVAERCDRVLFLQDGLLVDDVVDATSGQIADTLVRLRRA